MTKRAVFFSLDAIIAITIILLTILLAYPFLNEPKPETELQSDILQSLSTLKINEFDNAYAQALIAEGAISETNRSVLEAIGELYVKNITKARLLAQEIMQALKTKENIGIWYGNELLDSQNVSAYENAQKVETARQIISGIREGESVTGFSARASLQSKRQTKYVYIGGYIGEGNLTIPLEFNGTPLEATLEAATTSNFEMYVNTNFAGSYEKSPSPFEPRVYNISVAFLQNGTNAVELRARNLSISGGFLKLVYLSSVQYQQPVKYNFPGVKGVVNIYDGFYVPGTLQELGVSLHYNSPYNTFLTIGNTTVFNSNASGETYLSLSNNQLDALLDYNILSNKSIPLRFGLENISLLGEENGNIDVVLITDVSGSMNWRMDSDTTGITRDCIDPLLNQSSTKRISLARCLDLAFVATILNSTAQSRVALVSFSNDANSYTGLTNNRALLNNTIQAYTAGGATCVSCAINQAYQILQTQSSSNRTKFIVAMTDGVTNRRSTPECIDINGIGAPSNTNVYAGGANGLMLKREITSIWNTITTPATQTINDIDFFNETLGFAVGASGRVMRWNGTTWVNMTSPVTSAINHVDIFNETHALAVGASGRVMRWNGASWSLYTTISNSPTLYGVSMYNASVVFASGARSGSGRIYRSSNSGQSWSEVDNSGSEYRAVKVINGSKAFAVGASGRVMQWSGGSWTQIASSTSESLYAIEKYNSTLVFAAGGNNGKSIIIHYGGSSWSSSINQDGDTLRDIEVRNNVAYALGEGGVAYERNETSWERIFNIPPAYEGNETTGISCTADADSCAEINSFPGLNANYSSCRAHADLNATIYSVGFGPIATCTYATHVLQGVAECGNGTFYASSNAEELQEFYETIAQDLIRISYSEQTAETEGNVSATMYADSYLQFNYTKDETPYGLILSYEKLFDNETFATFDLPANATLLNAKVLSYSGARWTARVTSNNQTVYLLSDYGQDFTKRGDPFEIHLPSSSIQSQNNITLLTGLSPANLTGGSASNKIIYTILKNASGYSPIVSFSEGCIWTIDFDEGTNITMSAPSDYMGANQCNYQAVLVSYNNNDAAQQAVYRLLENMDLNKDNRVDIVFTEDDLEITLTEVTGVPFTWSTEVQVRVWR